MARARSLSEFQASFSDETSCAAFLVERRWPEGFVCPACGNGRAASLKSLAHTYECLGCGRQTSIAAGTVMHRSKLPLTVWFSNGMSALQFEAQLGINIQDRLVAGAEAATIDDRIPGASRWRAWSRSTKPKFPSAPATVFRSCQNPGRSSSPAPSR